jgi:hypothetical protein
MRPRYISLGNLVIEREQVLALLGMHLGVNYAKLKTTLQWLIQNTMICSPSCDKCGGEHRAENNDIRCSCYNGLGHLEDHYWKKDTKPSYRTTNYLDVLVNDEKATLTKLNRICGANHHLSSGNRIPKRRLSMQINEVKGIVE